MINTIIAYSTDYERSIADRLNCKSIDIKDLIAGGLQAENIDLLFLTNDFDKDITKNINNNIYNLYDYNLDESFSLLKILEIFLKTYRDNSNVNVYYIEEGKLRSSTVKKVEYELLKNKYYNEEEKELLVNEWFNEKMVRLPSPVVMDLRISRLKSIYYDISEAEKELNIDLIKLKEKINYEIHREYTDYEKMHLREKLRKKRLEERKRKEAEKRKKTRKRKKDLIEKLNKINKELEEITKEEGRY